MAKKPAYRAGRDQAATAENVELLTGQRGDRLDKAVTFRELAALGLSTLRSGAGGIYVPGKNPDLFPPGQMEFPHAPVNVIANGAFHTVLVEWDPPQYWGHAYAEIWRAESDNQAEATLVGTSSANLFSDAIGKGATFYYWVRFVNGKDDKGPFQGMQGVKAETSRDVQDILDELQGKIEESHLAQELLLPIQKVPQLSEDIELGSVTSVEASLANDIRDQENRKARGRIAVLQQVLADANESLARLVVQLTADFETETDELRGQVTIEAKARADKDEALGELIETVTAKAGELESAVQTHSQAIAGLETGAQAMWSVKAQAGDITAGIGLIANSDGTSQVAISASQVFVFNPNSSTPMAPLFAIDNGHAVIAEAIIRKATIQIIQSEKITADYVKAGVSISAPLITGGQIDMGNAFMADGSAGFGKGGPYGAWGYGWNTIIYNDGGIYTNRLYASGGTFTGTVNANAGTFNNVTINENCDVRGTIYADKIVGDVVAIKPVDLQFSQYKLYAGATVDLFSFSLAASNKARYIRIAGSSLSQPSQLTSDVRMMLLINGVVVKSAPNSVDGLHLVPANNSGPTQILFRGYHVSGYDYTYIAAQLKGEVTVYPTSSGTFI